MKTLRNISIATVVVLLAFTAQTIYAAGTSARKKTDQQSYLTLKGKVVDAETNTPLVLQQLLLWKLMLLL